MNSENSAEGPQGEEEKKIDKSLRRMKAIKSGPNDSSSPTGSLKSDSEEES